MSEVMNVGVMNVGQSGKILSHCSLFFLLQNVYDDKIMTRLTLRTNEGFPQQRERR